MFCLPMDQRRQDFGWNEEYCAESVTSNDWTRLKIDWIGFKTDQNNNPSLKTSTSQS